MVVDKGPNSLSSTSQNVSYTVSGHRSDAISFNRNISYFQIDGLTGLGTVNKPFSVSLSGFGQLHCQEHLSLLKTAQRVFIGACRS